ncbi:MAG: MarR family transcriptional regulator [Minwuia sp.]|nr:MarR family transcriptional regulator [Minwuia sp.]
MSTREDEIRIGFALAMVRMSRRWRWKLDQRLRATGLTQARWTALLQIARGGDGMQQTQLADHIGIEGPTLVRLLNSLEAADLIQRRADPRDRRAKTVHLTARAVPVLAEIEAIADDLRQEVTEGFAPDELARCTEIFDIMRARLDGERSGEPARGKAA